MKHMLVKIVTFFTLCLTSCNSDYASCAIQGPIALYKWWCWKFFPAILDFSSAMTACELDGGKLVTVYSQDYWVALLQYNNFVDPTGGNPSWVALYSFNESSAPVWMTGPNIATDAAKVTPASQSLFDNDNFTFSYGNCPGIRSFCSSMGITTLQCCYYLNGNNGGVYNINGQVCTKNCTPVAQFGSRSFICEYENPARATCIERAPNNGFMNSTMILNNTVAFDVKSCSILCMLTKFCMSFDYNSATQNCRLLPLTFRQASQNLVANVNFQHFDFSK